MKRWLFLTLLSLLACGGVARGANVRMDGYIDFYATHSRMHIYIEEIQNYSDVKTDRLRLRMYASDHHWQPNRKGQQIAFALLPRLYPHQDRHYIHLNRPWNSPDDGWYHVTIVIEERTRDETGKAKWEIRDAVEFDHEYYFGFDHWPFD